MIISMSKKFDIDNIARLARLELTAGEKEKLSGQMETILQYIDQLNELDTDKVEPTSHVLAIHNVFREDEETKNFSDRDYLASAPAPVKDHYEVPKII